MKEQIIQGDCLIEMKKITNKSIDCIITSPPYEDIAGAGYIANSKDILFLKLYSEFIEKLFRYIQFRYSYRRRNFIRIKLNLTNYSSTPVVSLDGRSNLGHSKVRSGRNLEPYRPYGCWGICYGRSIIRYRPI